MNYNKVIIKIKKWRSDYKRKKNAFSSKLAFYSVLYDINGTVMKIKIVQRWSLKKKSELVEESIHKYCEAAIQKVDNSRMRKIGLEHDFPIWTFWYQDINEAPELVKACIKNMKTIFTNEEFRLHVLTIDTLENYISFPTYIYNRVNNGEMGLALFSDLIRVSLLERYGGLWIDPTCFCTADIPKTIRKLDFYSCKTDNNNPVLVSKEQWANYCLGTSNIHDELYQFLREALLAYWKEQKCDVDYLLTDYLIRYAYSNIKYVRKIIDDLPENNCNRGRLLGIINSSYNKEEWKRLCRDTWLFKLTYKQNIKIVTTTGDNTFYSKLLGENNDFLK